MPYIYSTATNDGYYCNYDNGGGDLPVLKKKVLVKGGATRGGKGLITPLGVRTEVSEEDLAFLEANPAFQRHKSAGFITVFKSAKDPDKIAKDMTSHDGSSPQMVKGVAAAVGSADPIAKKAQAKG